MNRYFIAIISVALTSLLLHSCSKNSSYGTIICGEIYKTDGSHQTVDGDNRIKMPYRNKDITVLNNIYKKNSTKEKILYTDIDSIRVWHPASPDEIWTMVAVQKYGWCMRYVENPHINVLTYSENGYGLFASGKATNFYSWQVVTKSKIRFLIAKPGEPVADIGGVSGYGDAHWRERLCSFVSDDTALCSEIRQSRQSKIEILKLLSNYKNK